MERYHKFEKNKYFTWQENAKRMSDQLVDFFMVARMLRLKMKNVIIYSSTLHTDNVIDILAKLKFKRKTIKGKCHTV
jgi:hypothetical protein